MSVSPWIDENEWESVRALLHSEAQDERAAGVNHVLGLWCSRLCVPWALELNMPLNPHVNRGRVPTAAMSTAQLTLILDGDCTSEGARLALAMAIVRCINGISDALQGGRARDIRDVLGGLHPRVDVLIDARHDCTHGILPSMDALTRAARHALDMLSRCYWFNKRRDLELTAQAPESVLWDGAAETLLDSWSTWEESEIRAALGSVSGDSWRVTALERVRAVWGVHAWVWVAARANVGVLQWFAQHSVKSRRLAKAIYKRGVTEGLTFDSKTWESLQRKLKVDPAVTRWLLRHRPKVRIFVTYFGFYS
jgi:hypothetical protein